MRIDYLATLAAGGAGDVSVLRNPVRELPLRFDRLAQARRMGRSADAQKVPAYFPYTDMGRAQLDFLEATLGELRAGGVRG